MPNLRTPKDECPTLPIPDIPEDEMLSPGEAQQNMLRSMQLQQLNNVMRQNWKKQGKRSVAPKIELVARPDNPWRDRYLCCRDCERRMDEQGLEPRPNCNYSTLLELDMPAPFSRDNVMATSCELVQMIRDDVWVKKDTDGSLKRVENSEDGKKIPGSFPVQVCAVCRKTSLDEGRRFRMCLTCRGCSYCSDECYGKHRMIHKVSCIMPHLPYREEWGVRKPLRRMRDEIYPMIHKWAIREASAHRMSWLPPPKEHQKALRSGEKAIKPRLPGFSQRVRMLPASPTRSVKVQKDGKLAIVERKQRLATGMLRSRLEASLMPDPIELLNLGMTREEFVLRETQLYEEALREDAEERAASLSLEAEVIEQEPEEEAAGLPEAAKLTLSKEAVARLEAAGADAPEQAPEELSLAPWEELAEDEKNLTPRERTVKRLAPPNMPPEEDRKEGVVYKESLVRELAKKKGLQLSPDALERLEEAAAAGKRAEHVRKLGPYKKDDSLLL